MNNSLIKKILPHVFAYLMFVVVAMVFFAPMVFNGKTLVRGDNTQSEGMQGEIRKVSKETGDLPLWTNAMFSGMPSYQILYRSKNQLQKPFKMLLWGNNMQPPHTAMILGMLGIYILFITMKFDWRISMFGAICFILGTNFMDLIVTGHATKVIALSYLAPTLAGILLAFRGRYLLGATMAAFFMGLQLWANHLQVTYYFLMTLLCFGFVVLYKNVKDGTMPHFFKASGAIIVAFLLAFATNTGRLLTTNEYSKESIRGTSELTKAVLPGNSNVTAGGMSKDYAFSWSIGKLESFMLIVPKFSGENHFNNFLNERNNQVTKAFQSNATMQQVPQQQRQQFAQQVSGYTAHYWGNQPFVGGPFYFGIIVVFLSFLGAFLVRSPLKWWLVSGAILMIMVAWGRHLSFFNYTMFDYFPMFNKFRAVSTALSASWLMVLILGFWGLKEFLSKEINFEEKKSALIKAGGVMAGLLLITLGISFGMVDLMPSEKVANLAQQAENNQSAKLLLQVVDDLTPALIAERGAIIRSDIFRSIIFLVLAFVPMFFYTRQGFKSLYVVLIVGSLAAFDLGGVSKRYFTKDTFVNPKVVENRHAPNPADLQILADTDPHFRVFDTQGGLKGSSRASFHHKSVGGYHAAKLMRYEELIEKYMNNPGQYPHVYDMLNTKYFIQNGQAQRNPNAYGNAWFVNSYDVVNTADEEFLGIANLKPKEKALIHKDAAATIGNITPDPSANIRLTKYHPDRMEYVYSANSDQLAVFSEVYYPSDKGWNLYVDGEKQPPIIRANYVLRAAKLPAGQNRKLEMVFEPSTYYTGETISLIASLLVLLGFLGGLFWYFKNNELPNPDTLPEEKLKKVVQKKAVLEKTQSKTTTTTKKKSKKKKK